MYKLCIAEKPSVAKDIARVIGADNKKNGYFEGNGYRVTWAVGHLVGLEEPEAYGYVSKTQMWDREYPEYKAKALSELPLFPDKFKTKVLENTKEQFYIVKDLMLSDDCSEVINCGDFGAEGHVLQWLIRDKVGCTKPELRFCATSMTDEAITDAMAHLRDAKEFLPIIRAEMCKKKADWIMGMTMSRCGSITYSARVDVGRVQSPTLYFIVNRYLAVKNFKVSDFYSLRADMAGGFSVKWEKDTSNQLPLTVKDSDNRLIDKAYADKTAGDIERGKNGKVVVFETKGKATDRPQLYDITELERDGNRIFGYSAEQVLNCAQSLYEKHKVTTYPRTDSRYITHDIVPYLEKRIKGIANHNQYTDVANLVLQNGLNIDNKIVCDEKVTDHHAIICTSKIDNFDFSVLSEAEKNVLNLVIVRMLVSLSGKYKYKETVLKIAFSNGLVFGATGKIPVEKGWKKIQELLTGNGDIVDDDEKEKEEEQIFPNLAVGQMVDIKSVNVVARKTTPPKLHTEATLLTAMENAGAIIENGAILKGKGIGTQATRANIIKSLFDKGYVTNEGRGKSKFIVPTSYGLNVIKVLPEELYSPKITADWETMISEIVDGKRTEEDFMKTFKIFILRMIDLVKNNRIENISFNSKEAVGVCPWCKSNLFNGVLEKDGIKYKTIYCGNKECKFSLKANDYTFVSHVGKNATEAQLKKLASQGSLTLSLESKAGRKYDALFTVKKNDKGYAFLEFGFPQNKKKANSLKKLL